jgi:hypothetical protein
MKIDDLNELPEWNDEDMFRDEEDEPRETWKPNPTRDLCKAMYAQWNQVMIVLKASLDSLKKPRKDSLYSKEHIDDMVNSLMADAYEAGVKIRSSEAGGLYIIRMENAAIIRKNAQYIKISTNGFVMDGLMEEEHRTIIRDEIDKFRALFKQWVSSFKKDECEDDWGLFV